MTIFAPMTADNIKFRCSSLGHIMTEAQGKADLQKYAEAKAKLTEHQREYEAFLNRGTKTALNKHAQILKLQAEIQELEKTKDQFKPSATCRAEIIRTFARSKGRMEELKNKYLDKGNEREEDSITLLCAELRRFYRKNKTRLENEYVSGEPDLFDGESIESAEETIDTKTCWSYITFLESKDNDLKALYEWQGHGYMWLTGAKKHTVVFCLLNGTRQFIIDSIRTLAWKYGVLDADISGDENFIEAVRQLERNHIFDIDAFMKENPDYPVKNEVMYDTPTNKYSWGFDIPRSERIHTKTFYRDEAKIERIKTRVPQCREVMQRDYFKK